MSIPPQITFLACLPRSRSAWCANLLTHGPSFAYHEPLRWAVQDSGPADGTPAQVPNWLELARLAGTEYVTFCDTAFAYYWKRAMESVPKARALILWQGAEVSRLDWNKAVAKAGQPSLHNELGNEFYHMERELRQLEEYGLPASRVGHMRVKSLDRMSGVQALWEFCTGYGPFSPKLDLRRARMLMDLDIQAILPRYIDDSGAAPKVRMIGDVAPSPQPSPPVGAREKTKGVPCH